MSSYVRCLGRAELRCLLRWAVDIERLQHGGSAVASRTICGARMRGFVPVQ